MIAFSTQLDTRRMDMFLFRLPDALSYAADRSAIKLRIIAEDAIDELDALDTGALKESLYNSSARGSDYAQSVAAASSAYQFNPTKWPAIREANGGVLDIDPELKTRSPYIAYMGVAASHGKAVEEGYVSFYGNDIPARPFVAMTATDGFPVVIDTFRDAIIRALR